MNKEDFTVSRNDEKYECIFMHPYINSAQQSVDITMT